ncbi:MAG: CRTAC1 family protein [Pirellulaceae bacterium]
MKRALHSQAKILCAAWLVRRRAFVGLCVLLASGCNGGKTDQPSQPDASLPLVVAPRAPAEGSPAKAPVRTSRFRDVHQEAHLEHVYENGERGRVLLMETTGGGAGWLDYDADGKWDLYLNQGGDATADAGTVQPLDRLFRNLGDGNFQDVTAGAGIVEPRYSQGVAVGDFDNDGFDDVYVTNLGRNTLLHNQGDGTFQDVTEQAKVGDERWSTSAAWADLDLDGDLDLYVCNYCIYDPDNPIVSRSTKGEPRIVHPGSIPPWPDECYINLGDGTFSAEATSRGLAEASGRGLGVAVADLNKDGWPDIFVTNDTTMNFCFINQGQGQFVESAAILGCATDANGNQMANMGVAVNDLDANGFQDLYVTHFHMEADSLYLNYGPGGFRDESSITGLVPLTMDRLAFGAVMADFNQDGALEVMTACGHIENSPGFPLYRMAPQFLAFDGHRWRDDSQQAGEYFRGKYVGRAVAAGDYDEDGDWDLVVAHENDPAALLRNESERGHWLKFFFRCQESNRRGIGSRLEVRCGDVTLTQELCGGTSYAATHQAALIFGLGEERGPWEVTIRWPSGRTQTLQEVAVDQTLVLEESQARPVAARAPRPENVFGNHQTGREATR